MKAFKKYKHCGDTYYTGAETPATPNCGECGEKIEEAEAVEIYKDDENILNDTKPVEIYHSVEQYEENEK